MRNKFVCIGSCTFTTLNTYQVTHQSKVTWMLLPRAVLYPAKGIMLQTEVVTHTKRQRDIPRRQLPKVLDVVQQRNYFPERHFLITSFYGEEFHMLEVSFSYFYCRPQRHYQVSHSNNYGFQPIQAGE